VNGLGPFLLEYTANGRVAERSGNRSDYAAPHGAFQCAGPGGPASEAEGRASQTSDDRWCVIAVFDDAQWNALKREMGDPEWAQSERFATLLARKRNEDELEQRLDEWTRTLPPEEIAERLQAAGVPAGIVQNAQDVLDGDQHLKARGYYVYLDHPETGRSAYDGPPYRLEETPGLLSSPAPLLGQHNDYVLHKLLGVPDERTADLLVNQVVF
jgi:crotonobetainyl-CoA:carnitine CoA-transferase CaiB-like acyl-CoA transferase